jgi:formylglycine-generating enzyme required for sulfatase activity
LSRITLIRSPQGESRLQTEDYPLTIGGGPQAAIRIPGEDDPVAFIGQEQGHAFVQPADGATPLWHNHQRLSASAWLKSGDQLQIGAWRVLWQIKGDQISITIAEDDPDSAGPRPLTPPASPPPIPAPQTPGRPRPAPGTRHGFRWLLLSAFLVLVLAAAFVIFSSTLTLEIEPEPEELTLRGFPPALLLENRALALPGRYTLHASRPGYLELAASIDVAFGQDRIHQFRLEKAPGRLSLTSIPAGARLFVDGSAAGATPLQDLELAPGRHRIRLEAPHHLPAEQELEIIGMGQAQTLNLVLAPNWAPVTLQSDPAGADVMEADRGLGRTPLTTQLDAGEHRLELRKPGYKIHSVSIQIAAGEPRTLPLIRLEELDGTLRLVTRPAGGVVTVDDQYQGRTPLQLQLSPRQTHSVRITKTGFAPQRKNIELRPGEDRELSLELKQEYGTVFLSVRPADAELLVDGKRKGPAVTRLRLSTRPHRIELRKKGYVPYRATVTPRSGISQNVEVVLKPASGGKATRNPKADVLTTAAGQRLKRVQPRGPVTLGASRREPGRRSNENLRQVLLTRPYFIATREVTNGEFRRFRGTHGTREQSGLNLNRDNQPAVNVSWDDTARYLNWLSAQDSLPPAYEERNGRMRLVRPVGTGYRLPTEAEWAYAARYAGRSKAAQYPWGERRFPPTRVQGNYADESARPHLPVVIEDYTDGHALSAPAGSFDPNPIGLYDMDGNAAEWCLDYYSIYPGVTSTPVKDPLGPEDGRHHVIRGSSWRDASITELRLSYRDYGDKPRNDLGFRIARFAQ